jgi:hypothetical protein
MAKYILNPKYGDMSVVILGSSLKTIKKSLMKHWEDMLEHPKYYYKEHIEGANNILNKEYSNIEDLIEDYHKLNEDYSFEEAY